DGLRRGGGVLRRPVRVLVQAPAELAEADRLERLAQGFVRDAAARHRIAHDVAEPADRQVRPLREKQDPRVSGGADLAAPEWPDTGDRADERALAPAPGAGEQARVAAADGGSDVRHEAVAVRSLEVDAGHAQMRRAPLDAPEAARPLVVHRFE